MMSSHNKLESLRVHLRGGFLTKLNGKAASVAPAGAAIIFAAVLGAAPVLLSVSPASAQDITVDGTNLLTNGGATTLGSDTGTSGTVDIGAPVIVDGAITGDSVTATTGDIAATAGSVTAGTDVTANGDVTATTGDIAATAGSVTAGTTVSAGTTVTAGTGVTATTGDIAATAGSVTAGTTVSAGTTVTAGKIGRASCRERV